MTLTFFVALCVGQRKETAIGRCCFRNIQCWELVPDRNHPSRNACNLPERSERVEMRWMPKNTFISLEAAVRVGGPLCYFDGFACFVRCSTARIKPDATFRAWSLEKTNGGPSVTYSLPLCNVISHSFCPSGCSHSQLRTNTSWHDLFSLAGAK